METVKMSGGNSQVKNQVSVKTAVAQKASAGDDFMKLLQLKQNQPAEETTDTKKGQTKDSGKADEAKDVKEQPKKTEEKDASSEEVSQQDAVLQAALQQAVAQMAVLPETQTETTVQTVETVTQIPGDAVAAEAVNQVQSEAVETKAETAVTAYEQKPDESQAAVAKPEEHPAQVQQDTSRVQQLSTEKNHEEQGPAVESRKNQEPESAGKKVETDDGKRDQVYGADSVRGEADKGPVAEKTEQVPLKTTQSDLPQDLGKTLADRFARGPQTLVVELEPASLGKLTIKLVYEAGRAAVSIMASNPKTLELLSQKAAEIASILEEKTGEETLIYTQAPEKEQQEPDQNQGGHSGQQDRQEQHRDQPENQHQTESFAQQLRLGLV